MTFLAMLRHAETVWTQEGRIQGRSDIPLSPEGKAELRTRALPAQWRTARAVSSPLKRCLETGSLLGLEEIASDARLAEMSWGHWEGSRLADLRSQLGQAMLANEAQGLDFMPPGGESPRMVFERARSLLAEIAAAGDPTLAIAHRGVIRAIFAQASGWDMRGRAPTKLNWKCLHVFRLAQDGMPAVHRLNVQMDSNNVSAGTA
jgi:broad specificity phosphatase PhoE